MSQKSQKSERRRRCPECSRRFLELEEPEAAAFLPFCSDRCKLADLGRWLGGEQAIAGEPASPEEMAAYIVQGEDERSR